MLFELTVNYTSLSCHKTDSNLEKVKLIIYKALLVSGLLLCIGHRSDASIFNLDSIAEMGKFPRFCVNTYRWGDKFFNGYDTVYVEPTGYKFNGKVIVDSWTDYYHPRFENKSSMTMTSDPSSSLGFYLTYLAVSVGYDINISKYFGVDTQSRKRWQFGFNCMLFAADLYFIRNDVGTTIKDFNYPDGVKSKLDMPFEGINTSEWGFNVYYFFNHKRYSQAAAFNFSRIQKRSGGSFYAGVAFSKQNFQFDFSGLPGNVKDALPDDLIDYKYTLNCHNYAFVGGYGYNWVFHKDWNWGVTVAPMIGWTEGYIVQQDDKGKTFAMLLKARTGIVWNHSQWFASGTFSFQGNMVGSRERNLLTSYFTFNVSVGYRFNLW